MVHLVAAPPNRKRNKSADSLFLPCPSLICAPVLTVGLNDSKARVAESLQKQAPEIPRLQQPLESNVVPDGMEQATISDLHTKCPTTEPWHGVEACRITLRELSELTISISNWGDVARFSVFSIGLSHPVAPISTFQARDHTQYIGTPP